MKIYQVFRYDTCWDSPGEHILKSFNTRAKAEAFKSQQKGDGYCWYGIKEVEVL